MKKKILAVVLAVVILAVAAVGATLAWLMDTASVVNTFTLGNVKISLAETTGTNYKLIPGQVHAKDPKVTIDAGSEDCYLFVRIIEDNGALDDAVDALTWEVTEDWEAVGGQTGVYKYVGDAAKGTAIQILAGGTAGQVTVNDTLTQENIEVLQAAIDAETENAAPTLTVEAYAIQSANVAEEDAWAEIAAAFLA